MMRMRRKLMLLMVGHKGEEIHKGKIISYNFLYFCYFT